MKQDQARRNLEAMQPQIDEGVTEHELQPLPHMPWPAKGISDGTVGGDTRPAALDASNCHRAEHAMWAEPLDVSDGGRRIFRGGRA